MNIGFIGCGNMASAIIKGAVNANKVVAENINIYDISESAMQNIKNQYNVNVYDSDKALAHNSDIIIMAVKPNVLSEALSSIRKHTENKLIISIAAGKSIDFISNNLPDKTRIIRVMPNINAIVGEAICAYTANKYATDMDKKVIENILDGIGKTLYLDEKMFPLFGVLGGCTPAFAYMFIEEMARAGVKNGMTKDTALRIAAQSVYGSAKMILESDEHPYALIDKVCSPGGTTIEGITSLQADRFEQAIHNAIDKALEKDSKL